MNVLFLTHAFPRHSGDAAGSFLLRLARALAGEDIAVSVLAPAAPGLASRDVIDGIAVRRLRYAPAAWETLAYEGTMVEQVRASWRGRLALLGLLAAEASALRQAVREASASLVHAHWWFPNGVAAAAAVGRTPLVVTSHGSDVRLARSIKPARAGLAFVARRADAYTAVSQWLADEARALAPRLRVSVAPMPVDADRFIPPDTRPRDTLLFVGRLNAQKGLERLLRALPRLRARVTLDVVGAGDELSRLQALAATLEVADRVRWHGAQPYERLAWFYRGATALVVPSVEEGLGLVAAEAALCGAPVVGYDSGGLRDLVLHERTGRLAREITPEALAEEIDAVLALPDQGAALGAAGRAHALASVSPEAVARRYAGIYRAAIAARV